MIPILQSTRSLRLMNFPKSYPISRTGTGKTLSLTTSNATTRPFALYFVELSAIYPNTALALPVMCLWTIWCGTMAGRKVRFYARSAKRFFLQPKIIVFPKTPSWDVLIATTAWCIRKTVNTLSSTNVWIPNALTISTTWRKWIRNIWTKTMVKTNTNSTISTVNLR